MIIMAEICWQIDFEAKQPIYLQIYEQLKREIIQKSLSSGEKLPSIRRIAEQLSVSKTTVESAFRQLEMEGYIDSKKKIGYFVADLSHWAYQTEHTPPDTLKEKLPTAVQYDFSNDYIDGESFDFALWRKYTNQALREDHNRFFDYGEPQGAYELRWELARYLHQSRGVNCSAEQIVVGAGTQVLLHMLCGLLKEDYHQIGFEEPGFAFGRYVFMDHHMKVVPISLEEDGLSLKELQDEGLKLVYISPSNQFPTGRVMTIQKRMALLAYMAERQGLIIEDDYDSELRYFGRPIPSLQGLDREGLVIYVGSFSKILLPAIRVSYMVLPPKLLPLLTEKINFYNQTASVIEQLTLARFMADGQLEKQIRRTRKIYARKNQLLLEQLEKQMGERIRILGKETGLHVLLEVFCDKDSETIVKAAASVGIKVTSLKAYRFNPLENSRYPLVVMGYGGIKLEQIAPAVEKLAQVWFH